MKYAYEDLHDAQFESLVVFICQVLLGSSVQGFAKGPDGGRDAKFVGTAERHPSTAAPWVGTTIIQAKHTNGVNKSFSEGDFYSKTSNSTVIGKEIEKIKKLRAAGMLDNYMIFSNRRLGGITEAEIRKHIAEECDIPESSIFLCGVEQIEMYLKSFPEIASRADLNPVDSPLLVSPDDLAEIVVAFGKHKDTFAIPSADPPVSRTTFEAKNSANGMSKDYATAQRTRYLKETATIHAFLGSPDNEEYLTIYNSVTDEFELKIIAKRAQHNSFDDVFEYLADLLFKRDPILRKNKPLTRALLFYMYWTCDIGTIANASSD